MNILQLTGMCSTKYGGLENYFVELQKISTDNLIWVYNELPKNEKFIQDIYHFGGKIVIIDINSYKNYIRTVIRVIIEENIQIVQIHFGDNYTPIILRTFFPKIKIYKIYHSEVHIKNKLKQFVFSILNLPLNKIFCVSNGVKTGLEKIIGKSPKNEVLYLGVRKRPIYNYNLREDLHINESDLIITCIGFSISIKGLDILIQSIKLLKEKNLPNNIKVLIVGVSGTENEKLQHLVNESNIEDIIISLGIRNDIDDILNISDIYTQPSRREAISLSIMEALNYSLPVIASNVGGIPEIVKDGINGYLCEKENAIDLSEKLELLITNATRREQFGKESLSISKFFSLTESAKKLNNYYRMSNIK